MKNIQFTSWRTDLKVLIVLACTILVAVLAWPRFRDVKFRRDIAGSWTNGAFTMTLLSDGGWSSRDGSGSNLVLSYDGMWLVKDGSLIITSTNASGTKPHAPPGVESSKIIQLDDHHLVYAIESVNSYDNQTVSLNR